MSFDDFSNRWNSNLWRIKVSTSGLGGTGKGLKVVWHWHGQILLRDDPTAVRVCQNDSIFLLNVRIG